MGQLKVAMGWYRKSSPWTDLYISLRNCLSDFASVHKVHNCRQLYCVALDNRTVSDTHEIIEVREVC